MKNLVNKITSSTSNIYLQLLRYIVAGGIAFIADFGLLSLLTEHFGVHYLISTIIAYSVGLAITYLLSIFWIFDYRRSGSWVKELVVFAGIGLIGLGLTYLFMWLLTEELGIHYLLSKIGTTAIVFVWNFIAKKYVLFN